MSMAKGFVWAKEKWVEQDPIFTLQHQTDEKIQEWIYLKRKDVELVPCTTKMCALHLNLPQFFAIYQSCHGVIAPRKTLWSFEGSKLKPTAAVKLHI